MAAISVIFEIPLQAICINKGKSIDDGRWRKKYFVLLRNFNRPEVRLYDTKPQNMDEKSKVIPIQDGYQVFRKSQHRGKSHVCHLSTNQSEAFLWHGERHICDFICFFLRTLSKLKQNQRGCQSFIVRPERMEDVQRIGCFNAICTMVLSRCGITLALQLSGSIVGQWPLRCIRTYECSGRGRFVFEVGDLSPTGSTRLSFKTKFKDDAVMFDMIDEMVEETARLESIVLDQLNSDQSRESLQMKAFSEELIGLGNLAEASSDHSFDEHLKKLSRDIYDYLRDHLGGRSYSVPTILEETVGKREDRQSGTTPPRSLAISPPPVPCRPSNISDEVFISDGAMKLKNYIDMKKEKSQSRNAEEVALCRSSYLKPNCEKQQFDLGFYISPDTKSAHAKDNYSAPSDQPIKDFERNGDLNNKRNDGRSKDRRSEVRLYQSAPQDLPHKYNSLVLQGHDDDLDRALEVGEETYFVTELAPPIKDDKKLPNVPVKPLKLKFEKIKSNLKKPVIGGKA